MIFLAALIDLGAAAPPDPATLEKGKALYNGAGSCVACHMADGKGQTGTIPPLAGSDWLDDPERTIAIVLRGLSGPIKVNGKRYFGAMPPQLLFDDEKIAQIVTYVNHAWGNRGEAVTTEQVAVARAELPAALYTPEAILKAFPFEKNKRKANGTYKPDFDDTLTAVTEPVVYRTFMPGASPAAFAVALPGNQFYCWDAGECRLRYVWTKGGFIRGNQLHWSSNGKPVAQFNGTPYYRARSSLLEPGDYQHLADTNRRTPFYDTSEASDFPILISGIDAPPQFKGYRLIAGYPQFRYRLGGHEITELIRATDSGTGIVRSFSITPPAPITFRLTPDAAAQLSSSTGTIDRDGSLAIDAAGAAKFQITITEKDPAPAAITKPGGSN